MKKWIIIGISMLGILSLSAFSTETNHSSFKKIATLNDITAVINKNTTAKELDDLKAFFDENNIKLSIDKVEFNEQQEITLPDWVAEEVSDDPRYSNANLVKHPYTRW